VDVARKRIALTMKIGAAPARANRDRGERSGDNRYQGANRNERAPRRDEGFAGNSAMASAFAKLKR